MIITIRFLPVFCHLILINIFLGVIGAILCGGSQNGGLVPLNKNLWSISFVMVTSCFAFALLSFLYVIIDVKNWWKGQPFFYAGIAMTMSYNIFVISQAGLRSRSRSRSRSEPVFFGC